MASTPETSPPNTAQAGTFEHRHTVRFHEIDRAGIVYFARVFEYCHVAYEEMATQALGTSLEEFFATSPWAMPLAHAEADYQRPLRLGDRVVVQLRVARVGRRSVTYAYRLVDENDELRATAKLVHVFVNMADFQSMDAPAGFLEGLERIGLWSRTADSAD